MPFKDNIYFLDGQSLTPSDLQIIVDKNFKVDLSEEAWRKVEKSRLVIDNLMSQKGRVVYGINTGFGNFADKIISDNELEQLQINLVRSHAVGVGDPISPLIAKRMMVLRINTLSKGRSGISPENLKKYLNALNANYIPMIPEKGTVGASGDLAPLSHLALGMMGQGLAWNDKQSKFTEAGPIMKEKNLEPINLKAKEGLALINGTQFMSSILSQTIMQARLLLQSAIIVFAFSVQAFGLQAELLSEQIISYYQKQQSSMGIVMRKVRELLDQSPSDLHINRLKHPKSSSNNQSSSLVNGFENLASVIENLDFCQRLLTEEMNSATDNPLAYSKDDGFETDQLISAGNFHGEYVAKASDYLSMALFALGRFSQARIQRYLNGRTSNLPSFLVKKGGLNSGFMIVQYTSAALLSECKVLVKPASADSITTSASQEDHVSMGGFAARKSKIILQNVGYIVGIELMHTLQGIDLIGEKMSKKLACIHQQVRKSNVQFIEKDSYFGPQITIAKELVMKGLQKIIA